jgi:biopolymer transport protein ExbB
MLLFLADVAPVEESVNLFSLLQRGGPLMAVLFVLSIVATGVLIERLVFFRRSKMNVNEFLSGILTLVAQGRYGEATKITQEGHGPVVRVVATAISKRSLPPSELREVVREIAQLEIPRLESNISMLATIGYIAPLLGLLGTVIGLIETFIHLNRTSGASSIAELSTGIYTALITPAAGLSLAIPCFLAYNFLVAQVQAIISDMERAGIEVIHALTDAARKAASPNSSTAPNGSASTPPGRPPGPNDSSAGSKAFGQT